MLQQILKGRVATNVEFKSDKFNMILAKVDHVML